MQNVKPSVFLFVGLGNPGTRYAKTRHNIGWMVIEALAKKYQCLISQDNRFCAKVGKTSIGDVIVHFLLPQTYMNLSGDAVSRYLEYYKLFAHQIVVVTDDIALPFGQLRLRSTGSAGGHNGLKSIEARLKTKNYPRLRMGVGHPAEVVDDELRLNLADYVLSPFTSTEQSELSTFIDRGSQVLENIVKQDLTTVIQVVNTASKQLPPKTKLLEAEIDLTKAPLEG